MTSLDIEVSAFKAARIALTMAPSQTNIPYVIVIGGEGNIVTKIERLGVLKLRTPLSSDIMLSGPLVYDRFWLNFASGNFSLGRYGNAEPFFNWLDPNPLEFRSIGLMTWYGSTGRWKFHSFC
ncbi:C3 and PZP-like alpha-2-macroglobulin domain-containing protein 8 [Diadema setosum]|uniref:C3 and PZP-like alpha-2-macroglobulin domain-containing protein 8 n=1 Tax=Diadema setosum TaxID=31175 RepID=UPI003B3B4C08